MRRVTVVSIFIAAMAGIALAASPDLDQFRNCSYCGMDRSKYDHSRMLIKYDDGTFVGTCSLHCAAIDLAVKMDKTPLHIYVGDYRSRKLIDAEKAFWVIGGSRQGVMTSNPKWAFETKDEAAAFIKESGGTLGSFDDSIGATYLDLYRDTKKIRERRKLKRGMGGGGQR